jgi:transcriptional regulator with XRE-family HTH domain
VSAVEIKNTPTHWVIGRYLRQLREKRGHGLRQLATSLEISATYLSKLERAPASTRISAALASRINKYEGEMPALAPSEMPHGTFQRDAYEAWRMGGGLDAIHERLVKRGYKTEKAQTNDWLVANGYHRR